MLSSATTFTCLLFRAGRGKVEDRGFNPPHRFAFSNEAIDFLERCLANPNLSTILANLRRHILEKVDALPFLFLV